MPVGEDYLVDSLFHEMRSVLGIAVVDYPKRDISYVTHRTSAASMVAASHRTASSRTPRSTIASTLKPRPRPRPTLSSSPMLGTTGHCSTSSCGARPGRGSLSSTAPTRTSRPPTASGVWRARRRRWLARGQPRLTCFKPELRPGPLICSAHARSAGGFRFRRCPSASICARGSASVREEPAADRDPQGESLPRQRRRRTFSHATSSIPRSLAASAPPFAHLQRRGGVLPRPPRFLFRDHDKAWRLGLPPPLRDRRQRLRPVPRPQPEASDEPAL